MKYKTPACYALIACLCMAILSCSQPNTGPVDAKITGVGWYISTLPSDYWASSSEPYLVYDFYVDYSGNIDSSDIDYVKVKSIGANWVWTLDPSSGFNATYQYIKGSGFYFNGHHTELPIGPMKAEIKLTNGKASECSFTTGYPGSSSAGSYSYLNSDVDALPAYTPAATALPRPTGVILGGRGTMSVAVAFNTNSAIIRNGFIWYYDSSGNYIGRSPFFMGDGATAMLSSKFTLGFNTSGANTFTVTSAADLTDGNGKAVTTANFQSIWKCRVVVVDGHQFDGNATKTYISFDHRAVSSLSTP